MLSRLRDIRSLQVPALLVTVAVTFYFNFRDVVFLDLGMQGAGVVLAGVETPEG